MSYFVDVQISSAEGPTTVRLGPEFETLDEANAAAAAYLDEMGLPPGAAHYRVVDQDGREVASTEEPQG